MPTIADILIAKGNAEANAVSQRGNIYADLIRNLSSLPGQVIQQQRATELTNMERQRLQSQVQSAATENALRQQQLQAGQRDIDAQAILGQVPRKPDGTIDVEAAAEMAKQHDPSLVPHVTQMGQKLNTATTDYQLQQQKLEDMRRDSIGEVGLQLMQQPEDLGSFQLAVSELANKGLIPKESATGLLKSAIEQPGFIQQQAKQWILGSKEARSASAAKVIMQKEGDVPLIQEQVPGGGVKVSVAPGIPITKKPPTETEVALNATGGDPVAAMGLLKPAAPKDEFQTFKETYPATLGLKSWSQLSPTQQQAGLKAYDAQRADPALARQASAQQQQNDIQRKNQDFQSLTTARADIQKNADTPYAAAKSSADKLRTIVALAQNGNKVAGAEQALTATAALINEFGMKRINQTEINTTAGAGNVADKFLGWVGKYTEGQPIDAELQKNMLQIADSLDEVAAKDYAAKHAAINKLYGTNIPPTYDVKTPTTKSTSEQSGGSGITYQDYLKSKKK